MQFHPIRNFDLYDKHYKKRKKYFGVSVGFDLPSIEQAAIFNQYGFTATKKDDELLVTEEISEFDKLWTDAEITSFGDARKLTEAKETKDQNAIIATDSIYNTFTNYIDLLANEGGEPELLKEYNDINSRLTNELSLHDNLALLVQDLTLDSNLLEDQISKIDDTPKNQIANRVNTQLARQYKNDKQNVDYNLQLAINKLQGNNKYIETYEKLLDKVENESIQTITNLIDRANGDNQYIALNTTNGKYFITRDQTEMVNYLYKNRSGKLRKKDIIDEIRTDIDRILPIDNFIVKRQRAKIDDLDIDDFAQKRKINRYKR